MFMESKTFVVDSSVFIARYDELDTNHDNATLILRELSQALLIIHPYVVQEVVTVLTYKFGAAAGKQFIDDIRRSENILIPAVDINTDMEYFRSHSKKISFTDSSLINLSESLNASLLTFDKQMTRIAKNKRK